MFNELCNCCLLQFGFATSLQRTTYSLGKSLSCLGIANRTLLANNPIRCNPISVLETSFGNKRWPLGAVFPHYLVISARLSSYVYIIYEASTILGFHTTPQMFLNFSCFYLYSLPYPCKFWKNNQNYYTYM